MEDIKKEEELKNDLVPQNEQNVVQYKTMWNDAQLFQQAYKVATYLSKTEMIPSRYQSKPENCLIALDIANRTGYSPMAVMQNLYVVNGNPAWSGQMAIALVNGSRRFVNDLEFVFVGEQGTDDFGCFARAFRKSDGVELVSDVVTLRMAKDEGWYEKKGSKWKTMPTQMMMYRAGAFFARVHCPDLLIGLQTIDEVRDVSKTDIDENEPETITITLPKKNKE